MKGNQVDQRNRTEFVLSRVVLWTVLSLLIHLLALFALGPFLNLDNSETPEAEALRVVMLVEEKPIPEPEQPEEPDGQVVDLPEPPDKEKPDEATFLAEHARQVEEETRTEEYRINPEVLSPEYASEDRLELQNLVDLGVDSPSTGSQTGNDQFEPDRDGAMAAVPHPFQLTNRDGLEAPSASSHTEQRVTGAPNNDLLDVEVGTAVHLNTKEFLYAGYLNQIRRLVNFYWRQNLDNLPRGMQMIRPRYRTSVAVILTADGLLDSIEVMEESGAPPLDAAVVSAFRIAGPYPPPPEGMVATDGRADLGGMGFTVEVGQAHSAYMGVDPRAGVQFPGILKSPR